MGTAAVRRQETRRPQITTLYQLRSCRKGNNDKQGASQHLFRAAWGNGMVPHGSAYGQNGYTINRSWRGRSGMLTEAPGRDPSRSGVISPSQRARRTCELAGWGDKMQIDADLSEWDYGDYEGRTTPEIRQERPDWSLFRDGCCQRRDSGGSRTPRRPPHCSPPLSQRRRASLRAQSHVSILAARWLILPAKGGAYFELAPASVSALSFEHTVAEPVIALWNDDRPE